MQGRIQQVCGGPGLCVPLHHVRDFLLNAELVVQLDGVVLFPEGAHLGQVVLAELAVVLQHPPRAVHWLPVSTQGQQLGMSLIQFPHRDNFVVICFPAA